MVNWQSWNVDSTSDKIIVSILNFFKVIIVLWSCKNTSFFLGNLHWSILGVKTHDICNLLSNDSGEGYIYIYRESKWNKMLTIGKFR